MGWYYDHKPTIETDEGIKAKSKRGAFVKNWWATRWIKAMEAVMDRGRLQRGRRYARKGQVLSLTEAAGSIKAQVQGSRRTPYKVQIKLEPLSEAAWQQVVSALGQRPYFVAQLLAGQMPQEIEEAFTAVDLSLFPRRAELTQSCTCPDYATVCKHLAAVHYILGERFDEDPFLLFRLRGKPASELLAGLVPEAEAETDVADYEPAPPLADSLETFWQPGPELASFTVSIGKPEVPYPVLERLGEPDFLPQAERVLKHAYDLISETAVVTAYPESTEEIETE